jgi:hypothetical protein
VQTCLRHHEEYLKRKGSETVSERCMEYIDPSRCVVDKRVSMDFCVDRYEYPNELGELPWVLTSWRQARHLCREQGKRLCTEEEFNLACEGPELLPYTTGFVRDSEKCNIDKTYRQPDHSRQLLTYERCLGDKECRQELERLDQRHAIGANLECVSWAGVVDMNGNVNEWVERQGMEPPNRSGLKGGWWGPVRNRCRPTVRFHKEFDYGYEAGFRCCSSIGEEVVNTRFDTPKYNVSPEQLEERSKTKRTGLQRVKKRAETGEVPAASEAPSKPASAASATPDASTSEGKPPPASAFPVMPSEPDKAPSLLPGLPEPPRVPGPSVE